MLPHFPRGLYFALFTASGFAGLIYESVWTHYLKLFLGHAAYAQSLVLVVFMGGLSLGAALCGRMSARIRQPLLWYALIEAAIGVLALAFHELFDAATGWAYAAVLPALGDEWLALGAKLAVSCALILPQSVLLGATFPLMSAGLARARPAAAGESVAMLYFANSFGAAAGVLVSGFVLIEWAGLPGTLRTAGAINLAIAAAIAFGARSALDAPLAARAGAAAGAPLLLAVACLTGLASFIYEITWTRMLSLVLGSSTHAFELMLSAFILGLALGGLAMRKAVDRARQPERVLGWVQVAMGLAALATLPVYDLCFDLMEALMKALPRTDGGYLAFNLAGHGIAALVMLPATFLAGMTLPLITGALMRRGAGESAIGGAFAANTLGAIAGVLLAVHAGLPLLGLKATLMLGALLDCALGVLLLWRFGAGRRVLAPVLCACALLFVPLAVLFELDANKMAAGVYRHGELSSGRDARILYRRDGKTATVHLTLYQNSLSIRTNGKSDGSINLASLPRRSSDEITMVLTGALPLAVKAGARDAAVIGIGTGLTTHTLLQSDALERVDTVEIEAAMVEAARGFAPRNHSAFDDPRGRIEIDDAKTYFATRSRRYDLVISEPSNPWVSGVSGLFTREFYGRIRGHLNPGGILVQWFQLYEIDASLLASVMKALGEMFPHYAVFASGGQDLLILASDLPLPLPASAAIFEQSRLADELRKVHVLAPGDLDARYLGDRATLEPLFESYGMPANSDYYPVLDLNAARHRFTARNAAGIVAMLTSDVPVLELLEPARSLRPVNALGEGAYAFERIEKTRLARLARDFLLPGSAPQPPGIPAQLRKDLAEVRLRLTECLEPDAQDLRLRLGNVARAVNPYLPAAQADAVWAAIAGSPCHAGLRESTHSWIALYRAIAMRDAPSMARQAEELLSRQTDLDIESRETLLAAAMSGHIAAGSPQHAKAIWDRYAPGLPRSSIARPVFRLLRCHASRPDCATAFPAQPG